MPGMSIHVVDVSRGVVAAGMRVEICREPSSGPPLAVSDTRVAANGVLEDPALAATLVPGIYAVRFHVAEYFRRAGITIPVIPFLDIVDFRFGIDDPAQHYHLPMKLTPWGLSCFRGGA